MTRRIVAALGAAAAALVLVGGVVVLTDGDDDELGAAALAVADLPRVSDFSINGSGASCVFDEERGGLVYDDLRVSSRSTGALALTFYVQRDSLDDVAPGYTTTVLTFGGDTRSHTLDLVIPITREAYEAGYDDCQWSTGEA